MRATVIALALTSTMTVDQRDQWRFHLDPPSVAASADGRYVAFVSALQLARGDVDQRRDLYLLDLTSYRITLESVAFDTDAAADVQQPSMSGDGRYLTYQMGDRIVVRDRVTGASRVGGLGRHPAISADGRVAAFTSDNRKDIFVWDLAGDHAAAIGKGPTPKVSPSLSGNGRYVAFSSIGALHVMDRETGTIQHLGPGWDPSISGDGRYVAYVSQSGRRSNVFLADLQTGDRRLVSTGRAGSANGSSANPHISNDGRFVAYQSEASNLVREEDFNLLWDVFLWNRETGATQRVSGDGDVGWMEPSGGPVVGGPGTIVAFSSRHPTGASDKTNDFDLFVAIDLTRDQAVRRRQDDAHANRVIELRPMERPRNGDQDPRFCLVVKKC